MANNTILTGQVIAHEFLRLLGRRLDVMGTARYVPDALGYGAGDTITLRDESRYGLGVTGWPLVGRLDTITETQTAVNLQSAAVDMLLDERDLHLGIDMFSQLHLAPLSWQLAQGLNWPAGATLVTVPQNFPPAVSAQWP